MHSVGQMRTHFPQPKQNTAFTSAYPPFPIRMQLRGHSRTQAPQAEQPDGSAHAYSRESSRIRQPQNFPASFASGVRPTEIAPFGQNS